MRWVQIDILEKIHSNTNKYFLLYRFIKIRLASELIWNIVFFFSYLGNIELRSQRTLKRNIEKLLPLINTIILFRSHVFFYFFFGHEIPWETISGHGRQKLNLTANILKISVQNIQEISNILFQKWNRW